jgi:hypothetical protein
LNPPEKIPDVNLPRKKFLGTPLIFIFIILEYTGWATYICEDGYYVGKTVDSDQNVG